MMAQTRWTVGREQAQAEHPEQAAESRPGRGGLQGRAGHAGNISPPLLSRSVVSHAVRPPWTAARQALWSTGFSSRRAGTGGQALLQGTFPTPTGDGTCVHLCRLLPWQAGSSHVPPGRAGAASERAVQGSLWGVPSKPRVLLATAEQGQPWRLSSLRLSLRALEKRGPGLSVERQRLW